MGLFVIFLLNKRPFPSDLFEKDLEMDREAAVCNLNKNFQENGTLEKITEQVKGSNDCAFNFEECVASDSQGFNLSALDYFIPFI